MAADDEHQPATRSSHPEHPSGDRGREPVDDDSAEDRHENDREDIVRAGNPLLCQLGAERGRRRPGDDSARGHPRHERLLVPAERRAERRQCHGSGPNDQDHDCEQDERLRHHGSNVVG